MIRTDQIQLIRRIKSVQTLKAQQELARATTESQARKARSAAMAERANEKAEELNSYSTSRFNDLSHNDRPTFFSSVAVSIYRRRKEIASLGLRHRRLIWYWKIARDAQVEAERAMRTAQAAQDRIDSVTTRLQQRDNEAVELAADEDQIELFLAVNQHGH